MTLPVASALLRHEPPALLLGPTEAHDATHLRCRGVDEASWPWPRLLEGAAQVAGLLAGLQPGGPPNTAAIAEFRDVVIHRASHTGGVGLEATLDRRILHFWRCRVAVRSATGEALLDALVTIAPPPDGPEVAVRQLLAQEGFGDDLFNATQHACCVLVDQYVAAAGVAILDELGLSPALAQGTTLADLCRSGPLADGFTDSLVWLLELLANAGHVTRRGTNGSLRFATASPVPDRERLRARALALDAAYQPAFALIDAAARVYVQIARGVADADALLLRRLDLWAAYFTNANPYYALNNRVVARVAAREIGAIPEARILEVGAGMGSATVALLEELARTGARVASCTVTEPVDIFRRRAERATAAVATGVDLRFATLDLDHPWDRDGIPDGSIDVVWGVNVFHVARDLVRSLATVCRALAPGGRIVIGEGIRPAPHVPVAAEFPFRLLHGWRSVTLDPQCRPHPGFLAATHWRTALARAGFTDISIIPDTDRLNAHQPMIYPAAIVGRK